MGGKFLKLGLVLMAIFFAGISTARAATVYGLTGTNQLIRFDTATPGNVTTIGQITGLQAGENILGIDFRPATGQLFALGSTSRLYTINTLTGAATQVGAAGAFTLQGADFGFDFNPTVDRIRVVSNTGQNLRLNPNDGALAATDGQLNPGSPSITGAAYTNSFTGATTTTLYDIDSTSDRLLIQNPPNNGTLVDVGALGVNTTNNVGFDIATGQGTAFASLQVQGETASRLYTINLTTGAATAIGQIGGGSGLLLRDIAISNARTTVDYDGDNRTDFAVFRPSNNTYFALRSSNNSLFAHPFGLAQSDIPTPGDFDGDGRTDLAVYRTSGASGVFFVQNSSNNAFQAFQFGFSTDEPVARDYDGDGRTDFAVVRRQNNQLFWFIVNSSNGSFRAEQFGLATDVAAPGDYDGDGRTDLSVRRGDGNNPATFYINQSTAGFRAVQFGFGSDIVVPGDYDGDRRTDLAVVRQGTNYNWFVLQSATNTLRTAQFGTKPHLTAQGDYDGDGRTDIAVWDPLTGTFFVLRFNGSLIAQQFGQTTDVPVAFYDSF